MKAIILAAGFGQRMRPLTINTPKPLLKIGDHALIEYRLFALANAGIKEVVINVSYHPQQFINTLNDGSRYGLQIHYSFEPEHQPLDTGGAILKALPLLGDAPFIAMSADLWTDYPIQQLFMKLNGLAHIVLVDNPDHHQQGDFVLRDNHVYAEGEPKLNFAGIGIYDPKLFANTKPGKFSYIPLLIAAMQQHLISGEHYHGTWINVGTIAQLEMLQHKFRKENNAPFSA